MTDPRPIFAQEADEQECDRQMSASVEALAYEDSEVVDTGESDGD